MKLLAMACSATKRADAGDMPLLERYDGPMWQSLRARLFESPAAAAAFKAGQLRIVVLSAQFGFIDATTQTPNYDRMMTPTRAAEILSNPSCDRYVFEAMAQEASQVMFAGGALYRDVMWKASQLAPGCPKVRETDGTGIGHHRAELGAWLQGLFPAQLGFAL